LEAFWAKKMQKWLLGAFFDNRPRLKIRCIDKILKVLLHPIWIRRASAVAKAMAGRHHERGEIYLNYFLLCHTHYYLMLAYPFVRGEPVESIRRKIMLIGSH